MTPTEPRDPAPDGHAPSPSRPPAPTPVTPAPTRRTPPPTQRTPPPTQRTPRPTPRTSLPAPRQALLIGVAAGLLALLPHLLEGARLPVQNMGVGAQPPAAMPLSLLPLSQYMVDRIVGIAVAGAAAAALALRVSTLAGPTARRRALAGLAAVQAVVLAQSFAVLGDGLGIGATPRGWGAPYFWGLLGGTVAAFAASAGLLWWMTAPCVVKRTVAWGVAAVPLAVWVASFLPALVPAPASDPLPAMLREWLPGLFVGVALARCTVPPWRRLIGWVGALAALWLVPAVAGVITSTLGTRLVMGSPTRMLAFAREAWAFWIAQPQWGPLAVAVGVGLAGAALVRVLGPPRGPPTRT